MYLQGTSVSTVPRGTGSAEQPCSGLWCSGTTSAEFAPALAQCLCPSGGPWAHWHTWVPKTKWSAQGGLPALTRKPRRASIPPS